MAYTLQFLFVDQRVFILVAFNMTHYVRNVFVIDAAIHSRKFCLDKELLFDIVGLLMDKQQYHSYQGITAIINSITNIKASVLLSTASLLS